MVMDSMILQMTFQKILDYIDSDGDLVGASQDYNDSNRLVQTVFDHCELL